MTSISPYLSPHSTQTQPYVHPFKDYLLRVYYVPSAQDIAVNRTKPPTPLEVTFSRGISKETT